ncbi:type III sulfide quinone reductase, selenoprotein subtype [Desulfonatronum lacustre]|uniref:type III sulfide quinone reductase, selenoprotein subtype n=1 Tax=Desulfonatronum lacustre TaxID=66849 RepID=UPI00048E69DE|nr:FAD/NAD(P)-binding oxidoreductase [Desulfonatronum lacustre]SMP44720.1 sulfide:quinone oxidoreductase [Desulfonatronum zhilinae]
MRKIVILGAGTAGTMMANRLCENLRTEIDQNKISVTIVDEDRVHLYQPGLLFLPFSMYRSKEDVLKPRDVFLPSEVKFIVSKIEKVDPDARKVVMKKGTIDYDLLIIASGSRCDPTENEGLLGPNWQKSIFDFYTLDGALKLQQAMRSFKGGRLVLNVAEMPVKCPVAPPEFVMLSDWYFHERGIRDKVEIVFATPLSGPFTKPLASQTLKYVCEEKNIKIMPDFALSHVDNENKRIVSHDKREIDFDLLVSIPTMKGAQFIIDSDMGDPLGWVPTDNHTLQSKNFQDIFVIGDATNVPTSKAGSVAHFESEILIENILRHLDGLEPLPKFDGHSNCFIESGFGKALLIDFNYTQEPLPGKFPLPGAGPFTLLKETKMNHYGKMMFRWAYWHLLLKGKDLPVSPFMTMAGKEMPGSITA